MHQRLVKFIDHVVDRRRRWIDLERATGISRLRWRNAYIGKQRINGDMLEAIAKRWPQYLCWLMAGDAAVGAEQRDLEADAIGP
ncbi:hypothetical protein ACQUFY_00175 [Robbsia andropogonis]|uniref:hypothetical protein n=1 Tax=Robbsia andropogonis TaxID=28092 RepID=UPI003D240BAB